MIVLTAGPDALARLMRESAEVRLRCDQAAAHRQGGDGADAEARQPVVRLIVARSR